MTSMLVVFWFGSTGQFPPHAAFPAVVLLAVITVCVPPDLNYLKGVDVQQKADASCAASHALVKQCRGVLGAEQAKKSFLDVFGTSYNARNASHIRLAAGEGN